MTIRIKRSATPGAVPTTGDLVLGQLAINTNDGKLYAKKDVSGTESIVEIGGGGGGANNIGDVKLGYTSPGASWLATGGYYPKATYPGLATALGDAPDMGNLSSPAPTRIPVPYTPAPASTVISPQYCTATNGTVTVAVGSNGANSPRVQVSSDGVTWSAVACPLGGTIATSVTYAGSYFFVFGTAGEFAYSSDGITWTAPTLTLVNANRLNTAAYGSGVYVVGGMAATILYSSDLVTWTPLQSSAIPYVTGADNISRIVFGNGYFAAAASTGIYYSITGTSWKRVWGLSGNFTDIQFADNKFVATGPTVQAGYAYSPNGYQWTIRAPNGAVSVDNAFVYGSFSSTRSSTWSATDGTRMVVVAGPSLLYSDDGANWYVTSGIAQQGSPESINFSSIAYAAGNWVAGSNRGIFTSNNGVDWVGPLFVNSGGGAPPYACSAVAYGGGVWMVAFTTGGIYTSTDLTVWTRSTSVASVNQIVYGGGVWRYISGSGSNNYYSVDNGANWLSTTGAPSSGFVEMVYSASLGMWMATFGTAAVYYVSGSGSTWASGVVTGNANNIAIKAGTVVVSTSTSLCYSTNGTSWTTALTITNSTAFSGIMATGTTFYAYNLYRYFTSADGITWTSTACPRGAWMQFGFYHPVTNVVIAGRQTVGMYKISDGSFTPVFTPSTTTNSPYQYNATAIGLSNYTCNLIHDGSRFVGLPNMLSTRYSSDGVTWTGDVNTSTSLTANNVDELYYLNGKYIGLTGNSMIYYSSDGNLWSSTAMVAATLQGCAYGATLYVVGATSVTNTVYSSPDLVTWTARTCNVGSINNVYFYNGYFYALGTTGSARSLDGITWTSVPMGLSRQLYYFNSIFYALPSTASDSIYRSVDGATWTTVKIIGSSNGTQTTQLYGAAYNGSAVVVVGSNGYTARSTDDGINWTYYGVESYGTVPVIRWVDTNGSAFVAVTSTSNQAWYSSDGTNWQLCVLPTCNTTTTNTPVAVVYGGSTWVAYGTNYIAYSTDGQNWYLPPVSSLPFIPFLPYRVTYQNSNWIITGAGNMLSLASRWGWASSSSDLSTWTHHIADNGNIYYDVTWTGSRYITVGEAGVYRQSALFMLSSWASYVDVNESYFYAVSTIGGNTIAFGTSGCIAVGAAQPNRVLQGPNSATYFSRPCVNGTPTAAGFPFAYDSTSGRYVCGFYGMTSTDAITWTQSSYRNYGSIAAGSRVKTFSTGVTILFGSAGFNYSSSDGGVTWAAWKCQGTNSVFCDVAYGGGLYIAITGSGTQMISTDGFNWRFHPNTNAAGFYNAVLWTITYDSGVWVAAGNNIYTSTDGYNWTLQVSLSGLALYRIKKIVLDGIDTWVGVGSNGYVATGRILSGTTPNGWQFRRITSTATITPFFDFAWNGTTCVIVGSGAIVSTSDFKDFEVCGSIAYTMNTYTVAWTGTKFVAGPASTTYSYFVLYSTDGYTWTRRTVPSRATTGTLTGLSWVNNKLLTITQYGSIAYSADNLQFAQSYCNHTADLGTSSALRLKLVNGKYFYASSSGNYVSSDDGITFTNLRTLPGTAAVAYGASLYVAMVYDTGQTTGYTVYTSSDGITWAFATELAVDEIGAIGFTSSSSAKYVVDVVYASGYFFAAVNPSSQTGVTSVLLRSSDGVTWTPLATPFNAFGAVGSPIMATDGTTVYLSYTLATNNPNSNASTAYISSDAGASWTAVLSLGLFPMYQSGWWVGAYRKTQDFQTYTQSVGLNSATMFGQSLAAPAVVGNWLVGLTTASSQTTLSIGRLNGTATYAPARVTGNLSVGGSPYPSLVAISSLNKLVVPVASPTTYFPNVLLEIPLYSYNTSTTFYVPPETTGTPSYIYSGV